MKTSTVKWYGKNTFLMFSFPPKRKRKTFHLEKRTIVIMLATSIYLLIQQKIVYTTNYTYQVAKREPMNEWSITNQLTDKVHHLILQQ